eukprot:390064-Pyramimonas_sp.AAC.1
MPVSNGRFGSRWQQVRTTGARSGGRARGARWARQAPARGWHSWKASRNWCWTDRRKIKQQYQRQ